MDNLKSHSSMALIKLARKAFYNTPVQKWNITSAIYDKVFHAGYKDKELTATYFDVSLSFPGRDFTITPGLMGGFYEKFELTLFEDICKVSDYVVDVGGNIGLYSCVAAKAGCQVEVFEPVPENRKYLKRNINANKLSTKITIHNEAVSNKKGRTKIYLSEKNIGTHSLSSTAAASTKFIAVDVRTLDELFYKNKRPIEVLKIDVEGYDGYVLEGASKILQKDKPALFIELVPHHLLSAEYDPLRFLDIVFKNYKKVIIVDEVKSVCRTTTKQELLDSIRANQNVNLVAFTDKHEKVFKKRMK